MIKVLSLCAALLAPASTGLDPHGRALHLKLDADFNTSYDACITTVKQAGKYGVDPFISAALMYKTTKFSPKLAKRSSSDYRKSLRQFLQNDRQKAKIIENMAKRFADVYSRTHPGVVWNNPFANPDRLTEGRDQVAQNNPPLPPQDPRLNDLVEDLRRPRPHDYQRRRLDQKMQYDLQLLYSILGPGCRIEAKSRDYNNPEYYVHIDARNLREILWNIAGKTSSPHKPHTFQEYGDGKFILFLNTPKRVLTFTPYGQDIYIIMIK